MIISSPHTNTLVGKQINWLFIPLLMLISISSYAEDENSLFGQIQTLQNEHKISVTGLERIQNTDKILTSGNLEQQIKQLFSGYNHVVSRNTKGKIESIVILNKKQARKDTRIVLPTRSQGNHFTVSVSLSGNGRIWQTLDMVIDTGADLVVLPESMIAQLGFTDSSFTTGKMQTANGMTIARIGLLQEVKIEGETLENVEVAFIADRLLGGNKLLGMSALGRYQVNIDDKAQLITLIKK